MVEILVILDGASEARDASVCSLDLAETPALDRLADRGEREWVNLLPAGVPVGSETAIAALLGWTPGGAVDRGRVEAAARGVAVGDGERAWRVDVARRPDRHTLLLIGDEPLPRIEADVPVEVWPPGEVPPRILNAGTVVIGAPGAATGLGRLMGAAVVTPPGATGRPGSDLVGKRAAALAALRGGAERVVVHVGGPDEASHDRDRAAKIRCIEAADRELIGPLADAVAAAGGLIGVCPDHGCDPESGAHVPGPVPLVTWSGAMVAA